MSDLFDDFMRELRRRQQEASGQRPSSGQTPDTDGDEDVDEAEEEPVLYDPDADEGDGDGASERTRRPGEIPEEELIEFPRSRSGGSGGRPPTATRRSRTGGSGSGRRVVVALLLGVGLFALISLLTFGIDFISDLVWYQSVEYDAVFWTRIGAQFWLFLIGLVVALVFFLGNLWLAGRLTPPPVEGGSNAVRDFVSRLGEAAQRPSDEGPFGGGLFGPPGGPSGPRRRPTSEITIEAPEIPDLTPLAVGGLAVLGVLLALGVAGAASDAWETILLWVNRVPFSPDPNVAVTDPVFGQDIGFFLFELPFFRLLQSIAVALLVGALLVVFGRYLVGALRGGLVFRTPVRVHLGVLGALFLLVVAAGYQLDKYELAYTTNGVATGISYVDENARFLAYTVLTIVTALAAAFLVGGAFTRMLWPLGGAILVWFGAQLILTGVYPAVVDRFVVQPNRYVLEEPYIGYNIQMTRLAFDLDDWDELPYGGAAPLTEEAVINEAATFQNARLWDYRPLGQTLDQLQTFRQYYDFTDVDTDRYLLDGEPRQVMLSARELAPERLGATGWVNQKIVYTHGTGIAMVPVNEVVDQGRPQLIVRNLPPVSSNGAPEISQPRIYFGERPSDYVIVGADQAEFDYPRNVQAGESDQPVETRWSGDTGIRLDSTLMRLLYALRFRDLNLFISDQITSESQLLFHRSLSDRIPRVAPFLRYDKDPYLVVDGDGGLVYIQDAYTTSDRFPNADAFSAAALGTSALGTSPFTYIRNSVKIVTNAYDGRMTFYVSDDADPIIRAYQGVFPSLFRPLSELEEDLRPHLRYPEELFNVQTRMFGRYHVTNPLTFFQSDDLWTVPAVTGSEQSLPLEAYYVFMRMPGEDNEEFLLLQPMVPASRPNMISWVAARMDEPHYGDVRVYRFPADTTVLGPTQVEALIDQDPQISSQITLWNQSGSSVIRGNLIVVPIQDSLVYLQPVYLQSTSSAFPEFQRIVVATPSKVVWAPTLRGALELQFVDGGAPGPSPSPSPSPSPGASPTPAPSASPGETPAPGDVQALIEYANLHFELAQEALRNGDFATYGEEIALVETALEELARLTSGTPTP